MSQHDRVVAVVVTWNRRDLLDESLTAVAAQSTPPDVVIVVDNASTDGTAESVRTRPGAVELVVARRNTGGAGGFAIGLTAALAHEPDAVWMMDDDTVPEPAALEQLLAARRSSPGRPPAVVASRVLWTDGRDHPLNTPREKPGVRRSERRAAERVGCVPIRSASFVSVLVDAGVVGARGLPVADYFLWNDDFEFTTRLLRGNRGLFCPASVVVHKTATYGSTDADPGDRFFYEVRNKLWLFTRSHGLNPVEKVVYAGATLRRWARTLLKSDDRGRLLRALVRGLRAGLASGPRRTEEVVHGALADDPVRGPAGTAAQRGAATEPFSLLMSVWRGDDPAYLDAAFRSVVHAQTLRPDDVVLVQDGPVPPPLHAAIGNLVTSSPVPVTVLALDANVGLGTALDRGMTACAHDIVARMDADDIALPHRFAVQVPLVQAGVDIVGSSMVEFGDDPEVIVGKRVPPLDPASIRRLSRFMQPFNHPTVVYRRSAVQRAGGYRHLALMEDYLLFAKMIGGGAEVANVAEPLVLYRVGAGAYARRGGVAMVRSEWSLQRQLRRQGFTSRRQFVRNVAVRCGYRLVPETLRKTAYRRLIARRGER